MTQRLFDYMTQTADGVLLRLPAVLTDVSLQALDYKNVPSFTSSLTVDASAVEECDSVGIAVLIWLLQCAIRQQVAVHFVQLPVVVLRLLDLYNLHHKDLIFDAGKIN